MKPICFKCHRFYRVKKNGVAFVEGMPTHPDAKPGLEEPDSWKDYKLWMGDLFECQGCGHQILSGFGRQPVSEHYKPEFQAEKQRLGVAYRVNDC